MYSGYGMGELAVAPLDASYASAVTAMQFSPFCEALWAGTDSGHIYTLQVPTLQPYAHWQAHPGEPVLEVLAAGEGVLSLSQHRLALHGVGGAPRWRINDDTGQFSALCLEGGGAAVGGGGSGGAAGRAVLGRHGALMSVVDLATAKVVVEQEVQGMLGGEGITLLRGPVTRGSLCCATSMGRLALIDPRAKLRADSATMAAPGGVAALDARGDTVAAAGYSIRAGNVVAENCVKIFDLRAGLRLLYTLPTAGPPAALVFHPLLPASLLVALPSALFCLADTATGAVASLCQADMASDSLSTATLSGSGELVGLGGSGGYVHLWGDLAAGGGGGHMHLPHPHQHPQQQRRVNKAAASVMPVVPPARPRPVMELQEDDYFSTAPQYPPVLHPGAPPGANPSLASDWDFSDSCAVGLPPRVLDPALRRDLRVVDGVGYLPNPHYSRAKTLAEMMRELAPLRHGPGCRLSMKADWVDPAAARAERQRQRAAEGGVVLPLHYQYVEIKHYGRLKWEEFDFSYYNRTKFAGLENDQPNSYCNALLQALYFVPEFRALVMSHVPEPDTEFCLTCEVSFLFAMLQRASGLPCQATNLLRTLRSLREAAALGLLDGSGIGPAAGDSTGPGTGGGSGGAGSSETELSRRVAGLSRFVLEQMHRDASNARSAPNVPFRSGISPQPAPANANIASGLEALMGISFRQRMTCLAGPSTESIRESRTFQVDLQYPASREKAARNAEEARQLGLNRLPGAPSVMEDPPGTVPTFADLLRRSLLAASAGRAWVDETRGYSLVRKVRVPLSLPPLLTVNVAAGDSSEAGWWLPAKGADGVAPSGEADRLPWAIAVISRPQAWEVEVHQAETAAQLYEQLGPSLSGPGVVSCVYELCCAIFQIRDMDEATDPGPTRPGSRPHQGHLVAMVKVPQQYWDEVPEARITRSPPGSLAEFVSKQQGSGPTPGGPVTRGTAPASGAASAAAAPLAGPGSKLPAPARSMTANGSNGGSSTSAPWSSTATVANGGAPSSGAASASAASAAAASTTGSTAGAGAAGGSGTTNVTLGNGTGISLPDDLDDIFATGLSLGAGTPTSQTSSGGGAATGSAADGKAAEAASGAPAFGRNGAGAGASVSAAAAAASSESRQSCSGQGSDGRGGSTHPTRGHPQGPEWVLFNDFSVSPSCPPHEVTATYANQKLPCLLQYRQVPPPAHLATSATPSASSPSGQAASASSPTPGVTAHGAGSPATPQHRATSSGKEPQPGSGSGGKQPPGSARGYAAAASRGVGSGGGAAAGSAASSPSPSPSGPARPPMGPVMTMEQFRLLCSSPPLQGPMAGLPPFRFKPLDLSRFAPRPGLRFAIDAEFVASSPPESRTVERVVPELVTGPGGAGMTPGGLLVGPHHPAHPAHHPAPSGPDLVQLKQSRLTLARVAVVVAEPGPLAGSCCLDDYVRAVEPVYDYLTRWSGILPGDLDPAVSRHYTTTLKHTYLKLKYLLDCGCVFVGHDLRKDFRCINMVVPPEQVIDTSELFRHRGGRKLSLRFLASYLLGASMQGAGGGMAGAPMGPPGMGPMGPMGPIPHGAGGGAGGPGHFPGPHGGPPHMHPHPHMGPFPGPPMPPPQMMGHDAIEDARMAMRLYHKYLELTANDSFHRVLNEMYAWGKQYGWEPVSLRNGVPQQPQLPPPQQPFHMQQQQPHP